MDMKKTRLLALAAALCAGVAMPAYAQPGYGPNTYGPNDRYGTYDRQPGWDRIGSVDFSFRPDHETEYGNFGGRVQRLSFRARNGSVMCNRISATFNNGRTRELYRGSLQRGRDVVVDLPGQSRLIRRIDFNCRSMAPRVTRVDIAADIGRYRADWRRSPDWDRVWSRMFNWTDDQYGDNRYDYRYGGAGRDRLTGPLNTAGWITLGSEVFDGRYDRETTVTGFGGRDVERIGVRPVNNDARCSRITATFANGMTRELNIDDRQMLEEDRVYELDLPGGRRDVTRIDMACHAENGGRVTMMVMANR
jgi:hypothetical protein